jgi:hypothetical protein
MTIQALRNPNKTKDDVIAQLSDQLLAISTRYKSLGEKTIRLKYYSGIPC